MKRCIAFIACAASIFPAAADSILENGGFDKELAPWECDEGKLAPDPKKEDNRVLRIELEDGVFALTQDIQWPAEKKKLTLIFRIRASQATEASPVQLRVRIYDKDGNSELATGLKVEKSGVWIDFKSILERPGFEPVSFMLESNRGEGTLWVDDVTLE